MVLIPNKYKNLLAKDQNSPMGFDSIEDYRLREEFRKQTSWHIPSQSLINLILEHSPIVSIGCGHAYTESLASKNGADIICTDLSPHSGNGWCRGDKFYMPVEKLECKKAVLKYPERNVFMAWPPYDHPVAYRTAKAMKSGKILIYVGESHGGCTGDESFFYYLDENFEELKTTAKIKSWFGIHDNVFLYRKK